MGLAAVRPRSRHLMQMLQHVQSQACVPVVCTRPVPDAGLSWAGGAGSAA